MRRPKTNHLIAYEAGWKASSSGTADLDRAEMRFDRRGIADPKHMFSAGWADYAIDRPKYYSLDKAGLSNGNVHETYDD